MVGPAGLEPATLGLEIRCSIRLSYGPALNLIVLCAYPPSNPITSPLILPTWPRGSLRVFLFITVGLHRLDAWAGLCSDVSDALLRLLAGRRGTQEHLFHVVAIGRHAACPVVFVSCGHFIRAGRRQAAAKRSCSLSNRAHHHPARRGNFPAGIAVSRAGIPDRLGLGAVERSVSRRYFEHDRHFHDAHGSDVWCSFAGCWKISAPRACFGRSRSCNRSDDLPAHAAAVDNLASALASVAAGIVHQRRAQSGRTPAVALPDFSLDRFCFCWPGCRPIPVKLLGTQAQHPDTRVDRRRRNRAYLSGTVV